MHPRTAPRRQTKSGDVLVAERVEAVLAQPLTASPSARAASNEALVAEIAAYGTSLENAFVDLWLADRVVRWQRTAPTSRRGVVVMMLAIGVPWLLIPLALTAAAGQWAGAPILAWLAVALFRGLLTPIALIATRGYEKTLALERTISDEEELRDQLAWLHRWYRLRVSAIVGVVATALGLLTVGWLAPGGLMAVGIGSAVVLAMLFYDTGQAAFASLVFVAMSPRRSEYTYRLPWYRPLDSEPVRAFLRGQTYDEIVRSVWVTSLIVCAVILLGFGPALVLPATAFITAVGFLTVIGSAVSMRAMVQRIVRRLRGAQLADLQERIDAFGPQLAALSEAELARVKSLAEVHDLIEGSPTRLRVTDTLARVAVSLVIPAIAFVATVIGERYAQQVLDQVLP